MKKVLATIYFFLVLFFSVAQQYSSLTESGQINLKFSTHEITLGKENSFFNTVIIKNVTSKIFTGDLKFTTPANWEIVGDNEINIKLQPYDSTIIPVRVIVTKNVSGDIAYSVVASLVHNNKTIKSDNCFIKIKRISDLKILIPNKILYFDSKINEAQIKYYISNKGNTNEIIQTNLIGDNNLFIDNQDINNTIYSQEYLIPPHKDTSIIQTVKLKINDVPKEFYKIDIKIYSQDSIYQKNIWIQKINKDFKHEIPEENKCAIFEVSANNVFSTKKSLYSFLAKGNILFKKQTTLYYYLNTYNFNSETIDYYKNTIAYVGVKTAYTDVKLGSIYSKFNEMSYGYGTEAKAKFKSFSANSFYIINNKISQTLVGGEFSVPIKKINLNLGYAENSIQAYQQSSKILLTGLKFSLFKQHSLSVKTYFNKTDFSLNNAYQEKGMAVIANYRGESNKIKPYFRIEYGSPGYSGISRGKFIVYSGIQYKTNKRTFLNFLYTKNDMQFLIRGIQQIYQKSFTDYYELSFNKNLTKQVYLSAGPIFKNEKFNIPYLAIDPNIFFHTISPRIFFSVKQTNVTNSFYVRPRFELGQVFVKESLENSGNDNFFTYEFSLFGQYKKLSLYLIYRNGPRSLTNQYYYYTTLSKTNWLYFMPSYKNTFFKGKLFVDVRYNFMYNAVINNKYNSLTTLFKYAIGSGWYFRFLSSFTSQVIQNDVFNSISKYSSTYFEVALRKEFNCNQPRFKYYKLKIVFFKDLNGNRERDPGEPGLRNVLSSIELDPDVPDERKALDFTTSKLLTGPEGTITYDNIVNGNYILKYTLIGEVVGNFNREELEYKFVMDKDQTIYIPYLENNRIVGQVILNRDPLSALGNISLANIRITAEDTKGNTYAALTDKDGHFVLYTPVADHYIVRINNIFYESFDLQQPEFIVKFNGYKQFEVTFVFNEKKRKINFDNQITEEPNIDDIKLIRKTTLTGKIRDAISLEPIEAEIKIINNTTNKEVSRAVSNRITGNYNITYVAGPHYRMEVRANGYWEHVENLYIEQVISIQNINKDIMLNKLSENPEDQKTYILYKKAEEEFTQEFKAGQVIPLNLNFNQRQTSITPDVYPELDRLIELLNKNKSVKIEIAGYADDQTNDRVENILALRRAKSVARYLTTHGINENRISVKSYGNTRPLVPGANEKARKKNRRVEVIVK